MDEFAIRKTLADQLFKIIAGNGWSNCAAADFMGISRNELSDINEHLIYRNMMFLIQN